MDDTEGNFANNLIDIGCGAGYLLSALKKYKSFYFKHRTYPVVLNSKILSVDVDTIYDFKKAENFLS